MNDEDYPGEHEPPWDQPIDVLQSDGSYHTFDSVMALAIAQAAHNLVVEPYSTDPNEVARVAVEGVREAFDYAGVAVQIGRNGPLSEQRFD